MTCETRRKRLEAAPPIPFWHAFRPPRLDWVRRKPFLVLVRQPGPPPWLFFPLAGMASLLRLPISLFFLSFLFVSASPFSNSTNFYDPSQPNPYSFPRRISRRSCSRPAPPPLPNNCFPAVGFNTPSSVPASMDGWWCDPDDEFGFLGFSYEISTCEFTDVSLLHPFRSI